MLASFLGGADCCAFVTPVSIFGIPGSLATNRVPNFVLTADKITRHCDKSQTMLFLSVFLPWSLSTEPLKQ